MTQTQLPLSNGQRQHSLQAWLRQVLINTPFELQPLAGDASFRQYYRVHVEHQPYVVMDALPDKEDCQSFVAIAEGLLGTGICIPKVYATDYQQGFVLLSDLGDRLLLNELIANRRVDHFYRLAMDDLLAIQACDTHMMSTYTLPNYDLSLYQYEMDLFTDWFIGQLLHWTLSHQARQRVISVFEGLVNQANAQPQVCVHRDYHARNMLVQSDTVLGIIDFQDAVWGPMTYDLVSLLRDCYIDWPDEQVRGWVSYFHQQALANDRPVCQDIEQFMMWFDWMGLQRNLKCLGIFSRLHIRDHKSGYLQYFPRILNYAMTVCQRYSALRAFGDWLMDCRDAWIAQSNDNQHR